MNDLNLQQLQDKITPQLWELLLQIADAAEKRGWHLYLVGGIVRDLLLAQLSTANFRVQDIDLVVDGCQQPAQVGAGVALAKVVQKLYPDCQLNIFGTFQTAALLWGEDSIFGSLGVDIATTRTEFYPYPAANPIIEASSINRDLYRRDFTINAMALRLTPDSQHPPLLDLYGGLADLQAKQLRVLHPDSFIDDPTRIYRGVRFANRLGFKLEAQTEQYIREAISSGIYDRTAQINPKTPALQSRLKTELKYLFQVPYWRSTIELLGDLGALQCIHPSLKLDPELLDQLRLLDRCLIRFDPAESITHWQLRLETIIAHLVPEYRDQVARNLQLPTDSINRLNKLDLVESDLISSLSTFDQTSQIYRLLRQFDQQTLILIAARSTIVRRQIWKYLTVWVNIQPILTGEDLQRLGYQPGKQYRQILDKLFDAVLDGVITDKAAAEKLLLSDKSWQLKT